MRIVGRVLVGLLVLVLVLAAVAGGLFAWTVRRSFPQTDGTLTVPGLTGAVEVVRDERGVPDIYADNVSDLFVALGYTHAQDRFYEMDFRRHVTSGRLSEMFGASQVDTDAFLRTMGWRRVAAEEYRMLSPQARETLTSYAQGVNQYLADKSSAEISLEYVVLGLQNPTYQIEKWDPVDSIAWLKALAWDLNGNYDQEIARVITAAKVGIPRTEQLFPPYPYERNGTIMSDADNRRLARSPQLQQAQAAAVTRPAAAAAFGRVLASSNALESVLGPKGEGIGSDSWVVSGELTESGEPLLANDPHLAPAMPSIWYQAGMHCRSITPDCRYDVSGWTMAGLPGVFIGHNADISWGFTNLGPDVSDLVLERTRRGSYFVDGRRRPISVSTETIRVAGGQPVEIEVRSTAHGPILSDVVGGGGDSYRRVGRQAPVPAPGQSVKPTPAPRGKGYAVAMRWTALTPSPIYEAFEMINTARGWEEFREAAELLTVPAQNLVYADRAGNIGYQAPGAIPIRTGYDGKWPVPGWDSAFDWSGYIPFAQLPSVRNPPAGWITTANQEVVPPDYPQIVQSDPYSYGARALRINTRLAELVEDGRGMTPADMNAIQNDAGNDLAEFLVPRLLTFTPDESATEALRLFDGWDYQQGVDSAAGAYFNAFYKNLLDRMFTDELGTESDVAANAGDRFWEVIRTLWNKPGDPWWDDAATPQEEDRDQTVTQALDAAAAELTEEQGSDPGKWHWGALHLVEARNATLGESGVAPIEAIFNRGPLPVGGGGSIPLATGWLPTQGYEVTWIPSMRQVVDWSDLDRSTWVNFTGNSGHAYNADYVDQFDAWAQGETYPWSFTRDAVVANATNTLTLQPGG